MSVKIRLSRHGARKRPYYRIVVADARDPRDGRFIEQVGTYDPRTPAAALRLDQARVDGWIRKGAQPTRTVRNLMKRAGREAGPVAERVPPGAEKAAASSAAPEVPTRAETPAAAASAPTPGSPAQIPAETAAATAPKSPAPGENAAPPESPTEAAKPTEPTDPTTAETAAAPKE